MLFILLTHSFGRSTLQAVRVCHAGLSQHCGSPTCPLVLERSLPCFPLVDSSLLQPLGCSHFFAAFCAFQASGSTVRAWKRVVFPSVKLRFTWVYSPVVPTGCSVPQYRCVASLHSETLSLRNPAAVSFGWNKQQPPSIQSP